MASSARKKGNKYKKYIDFYPTLSPCVSYILSFFFVIGKPYIFSSTVHFGGSSRNIIRLAHLWNMSSFSPWLLLVTAIS